MNLLADWFYLWLDFTMFGIMGLAVVAGVGFCLGCPLPNSLHCSHA